MEWAARTIGVFYGLGGLMLLYQAWLNWRVQRALPRFLAPSPAEQAGDMVIAAGGLVVLLSGVSLALLSPLAVVAFLTGWSIQAAYLLGTPIRTRRRETLARHGRRRAVDAFAAYTMVTAGVLCLPMLGVLV